MSRPRRRPTADDLTPRERQALARIGRLGGHARRKAMSAEHAQLQASLEKTAVERAGLVAAMDRQKLAIFELVSSRRHGVALAEARDGICTICHVRLRPQVFNNVRRNEEIVQCDSCNRILFFVHTPAPAAQNP